MNTAPAPGLYVSANLKDRAAAMGLTAFVDERLPGSSWYLVVGGGEFGEKLESLEIKAKGET